MDPEIKEAVRRFNAAAENFDSFQTRLAELESKGAVIRGSREPRSNLVKLIGENASFKSVVAGESKGCRIPLNLELKTILGSTLFPPAGSPTSTYDVVSDRDERLHAYPRRALTLLDALPRLPTASNSFEFCRTVHSNTAAEQALEGDLKAQATLGTTLHESKIATVASWLPVSRQVLADAPALEQQLRSVLMYDVMARAEEMIVDGNATIDGLITQGVAFVGSGTTRADLLGECKANMLASGYRPSMFAVHPVDWHLICSKKDTAGAYVIGGTPASPIGPTLWDMPVVISAALDQGDALVIDGSCVAILDRAQAAVEVGLNADDFTRNLLTLLAEIRIGLAVFDTGGVRKLDFSGSPTIG